MIIPTLRIIHQKKLSTDVYGQPILGVMSWEMVCPVKLEFTSAHTTVRTDSSASHGHAYENTANVVILARKVSKIAIGDALTILGNKVVVMTTHQRYRATGEFDHIEVGCEIWV